MDFSRRAAAQTKYAPQAFGGILQYTSQAIAACEQDQKEMEAARKNKAQAANRRKWEELQNKVEEARRSQAQAKIAGMTDEEQSALYEQVKRELASRSPWIAQGSPRTFDGMIRGAMLARVMTSLKGKSTDVNIETS